MYDRTLSGTEVLSRFNATAIPEPSALALLALAGLAIVGRRLYLRRR